MVGSKWLGNNAWARVSRVGTLFGVTAMLCLTTGTQCFQPADPCLNVTCGDGEMCVNGDCLVACTTDADCNVADLCAPEACGTVTGGGDATYCVATPVECGEGEVCNPSTGACEAPCTADADCDDGTFCNGAETCNTETGQCALGTAPCTDPQMCDEENDACVDCLSDADCDDGDNCTTDACNAGTCSNEAVACQDGICNPDDGQCVECLTDGDCGDNQTCVANVCVTGCLVDTDCDDGDLCTTDTCDAGLCANTAVDCPDQVCNPDDGACVDCVTDGDCAEGDSCVNNVCTPPVSECTTDEDCASLDDGLYCNGVQACVDGACTLTNEDPCADTDCGGDTPVCSEGDTGAVCSCPTPGCTASFTLGQDALTGTSGDDVFCAPLEFNSGSGTQVATLQTGDSATGLAGTDTLNASSNATGATTIVPTLSGIEIINLTNFGGGALTLSGSNISDVTDINDISSVDDVTASNLAALANAGMTNLNDTSKTLKLSFRTAATTGTSDEVTLTLDNCSGGIFNLETGATNGVETMNVASNGDVANTLTTLTQTTGTSMATLNVTGAQSATLKAIPSTVLTINAGDASGGLTLGSGTKASDYTTFATNNMKALTGSTGDDEVIFAATLNTNDFTSSAPDLGDGDDIIQASLASSYTPINAFKNTETYRINATADSVTMTLTGATGLATLSNEADGTANTLTFQNVTATGGVFPTLMYRGDGTQAAQTYDTITYAATGTSGSSDALTIDVNNRDVALNASGTTNVHTIGALTAAGFENVTINAADGPATFSGLTLSTLINLTATGSSNVTTGTVASGSVTVLSADFSAVIGNVNTTLDYLATGASITGSTAGNNTITVGTNSTATTLTVTLGSGNDTYVGDTNTSCADTIQAGAGSDTITAGPGADIITTGTGVDTINMDTTDTDEQVTDTVADFSVSDDKITMDVSSLNAITAIGAMITGNDTAIAAGTAFSVEKATSDGYTIAAGTTLVVIDDDLATYANGAAALAAKTAWTIDLAGAADFEDNDAILIAYGDGSGNTRIAVAVDNGGTHTDTDNIDAVIDILVLTGVDPDDVATAMFNTWQ